MISVPYLKSYKTSSACLFSSLNFTKFWVIVLSLINDCYVKIESYEDDKGERDEIK